jgi:hypothetical protein
VGRRISGCWLPPTNLTFVHGNPGSRTRLHSGATVAGKEVGGTSPVKAVVLALISIGDQRNVLNGGDPGKRALRCGASVNLTTGHAGRASQDARMVRGTCQGELQRGRAEGEPIMKKLMIAVLAVTGSRLPSADPEACCAK